MTEPTFNFGAPCGKQPVAIERLPSGIPDEVARRIQATAAHGCYCRHDQKRTATLRTREGAGGISYIYIQCDACGHALGPALAKRHFRCSEIPPWNDGLEHVYNAVREARNDQIRAEFQEKYRQIPTEEEKLAALRQRQAEYRAWCRSSPEWAAIRERVMGRSRGWCEACLVEKATAVHHLDYAFGVLPPAWHLRSVCGPCHDRFHAEGDDWCAPGMAKNRPE